MAFFGITNLGYQSPFADRLLPSSRRGSETRDSRWDKLPELPRISSSRRLVCTDICSVYSQPVPFSADVHHGSHKRYKEMIRRAQVPRSPHQLYCVPLTDNQRYGWWLPIGETKTQDSWTIVHRFPRKNSEMTKFVKEMSMTDREFSLF
ncbi:sperm microtubule inner protein 11-like isoform X2 [Hoplias malabaricus]|uniref:sperm microtubule inner protein 11-like isoform X2 n=1 Tax=Hoplias malabaricus TaxID=27720 RepID=UPI003461D82F